MLSNNYTQKNISFVKLLLWLFLVSNLFYLPTISQGAQWATETIDDPRYYFIFTMPERDRKIAMANDGTLTIQYGTGAGDLLLAQKQANTDVWNYLSIFKDEFLSSAASPSFALDPQSRPHVAYIQYFTNNNELNIQLTVFNNDKWQVETVFTDVNTNCLAGPTLAVDTFSNDHILFAASESPETACRLLQYAHKNGNEWVYETIETNDSASILPKAITLDSSATPHVIYIAYNGTDYDLKYATKKNGVWSKSTIGLTGGLIESFSIELDNDERPHISYSTSYPDYEIKYAYFDGTNWQTQNIGASGLGTSIILDKNSTPHISFRGTSGTGLGLFYAFFDGVRWQITNVDSGSGIVGAECSIAIDSLSNIHISYVGENATIKHAVYNGIAWEIETVDIWRTVTGASIDLDSSGRPHISYSYGSSEIQYAYHDGIKWHIQTIFTGKHGEYVTPTSLALDSLNNPHVSFYDWENMDLQYGFNDGSGWQFQTINSKSIAVSPQISITLDANSKPCIVYFDETNNTIKYSYLENNNWVEEDISLPFVPTYGDIILSLHLDWLSKPHVLYRINTSLYYSFKNDTTWQTELVSNNVNSWSIGFALDKTSNPFVTYQDSKAKDFWYGYRDDSGWHFEEIGIHGKYRGDSSSLLFDKAGKPHISYSYSDYDQKEYFLKHAYLDGDAWQIDIVKSNINPFGIDSAISPKGQLNIAWINGFGTYSLEHASASFPQPKFPWWSFWPAVMKATQERAKQ
jgi:hypothetical protein